MSTNQYKKIIKQIWNFDFRTEYFNDYYHLNWYEINIVELMHHHLRRKIKNKRQLIILEYSQKIPGQAMICKEVEHVNIQNRLYKKDKGERHQKFDLAIIEFDKRPPNKFGDHVYWCYSHKPLVVFEFKYQYSVSLLDRDRIENEINRLINVIKFQQKKFENYVLCYFCFITDNNKENLNKIIFQCKKNRNKFQDQLKICFGTWDNKKWAVI